MIESRSFTLPNGLRVVHNHDDATAMIAMTVLYNVGARDESPDATGMAHLFEHLMFGGSVNVPDYDASMEIAGGWNNAWTNNDYTNFYDVIPAVNAETAFWLESDRMLGLAFSEKALEVQRNVVIEEFKQVCLNKPYGDIAHLLRPLVYNIHPYRWPTIGKEISHIERITNDDLKAFFYGHYAPNNAVLAISGNISFDDVRSLAEKWFGSIPRRDIQPRTYAPEPPIESARRLEVTRNVPHTTIAIAFPMCGYDSPEYASADIVTDILSTGRSSRFYRELVMGSDLFIDADASILGSDEPGYLLINAKLRKNSPTAIAEAEKAIYQQLDRISTYEPSEYELTRAVNKFESSYTFGTINFISKSQALAISAMHRENVNDIVPRYRALTPADITKTASKILNRNSSATLVYHPIK